MPDDYSEFSGPFRFKEGKTFAFDPEAGDYLRVNDVSEQWKADSDEFPTTKSQREAFFQQRIRLVEASGVSEDRKRPFLEALTQSLRDELDNPEVPPKPMPIPGGVGYGAYFKDGVLEFHNSSALYFKIVAIPKIGNVANEWLYLTSTNRAPKGVEAYVAYRRDDNPTFNIFDWSKNGSAQFALSRPYSLLDDYLISDSAGGKQYQMLLVVNSTRRIAATQWMNDVMVHNSTTKAYDLVYSSQYDLDLFDEGNYKWWGPIIETFPPFPFSINDVGFFDAQLLQDGLPMTKLTDALTDLKNDYPAPKIDFERPNYSFIVHW